MKQQLPRLFGTLLMPLLGLVLGPLACTGTRFEPGAAQLLSSIIESEWELGELYGEIELTDITRLPPHVSYAGFPVGEEKGGSWLRFTVWERERFDVSLYSGEVLVHHVVSDGESFWCDEGHTRKWSEVVEAVRIGVRESGLDWKELDAMLWPHSVVMTHLFPVSDGLIMDPVGFRGTARLAALTYFDAESFVTPTGQGEPKGAPVVGVQLGDPGMADFFWLYWVVKTDTPYLARRQIRVNGSIRKDFLFSDPMLLTGNTRTLVCLRKLRCISDSLGTFTSTLTRLEKLDRGVSEGEFQGQGQSQGQPISATMK